jgi:hypothetical protein
MKGRSQAQFVNGEKQPSNHNHGQIRESVLPPPYEPDREKYRSQPNQKTRGTKEGATGEQ